MLRRKKVKKPKTKNFNSRGTVEKILNEARRKQEKILNEAVEKRSKKG